MKLLNLEKSNQLAWINDEYQTQDETRVTIPEVSQNGNRGNPPDEEMAQAITFTDFTQATTFHGISYIFKPSSSFIRR